MKLKTVQLKNYRCFADSDPVPIHDMTILVGGNDCGKSSLLRALGLYFKIEKCVISINDFRKIGDVIAKTMEIELTFEIEEGDNSTEYKEYLIKNEIKAKRVYVNTDGAITNEKFFVYQNEFEEKKLYELKDLKAPELKELCGKFGKPYTNMDESVKLLTNFMSDEYESIPKKPNYVETNWQKLRLLLPSFELYDSSNYTNTQGMVQKTLSDVYRTYFYSTEGGQDKPLPFLTGKEDEIKKNLNEKLEKDLLERIREINKKVKSVKGKFQIDFASGFILETLLVDFGQGQGENPISNVGEGTKKRLFLVINEWDREIRRKTGPKKRVIRAYDEPDASLHYGAQKEMFYSLKKRSEDPEDKIQVIICTHSIAMVDRAPAGIINYLKEKDGSSLVNYLKGDEDGEVKEFLDSICEISGIKNSSLFFERCFLIVEGNTEENFLPRAYQRIKKRTLSEDGVVLINLQNNCSWQPFLKLLNKNKADATLLMLDNDTQANNDRKVTREKLGEIGFDASFIATNVIFIGTKEFEDMFSNEFISNCLNKYWSKIPGEQWSPEEIQALRNDAKFSTALVGYVNKYRESHAVVYKTFGKPEFGRKMAEEITSEQFEGIRAFQTLSTRIQEIIK